MDELAKLLLSCQELRDEISLQISNLIKEAKKGLETDDEEIDLVGQYRGRR